MLYKIYKITDLKGRVLYVGMTSKSLQERLNKHFYNHTGKFGKYIRKHGKNNFKIITIDYAYTKQDAARKEGFWIRFYLDILHIHLLNEYKSTNPLKHVTIKHDYSGENNPFYGKHHTKETKQKITNYLLTNNPFKGKHHSKKTKQIISEKNKGIHAGGKNPAAIKIKCIETEEIFDCIRDTLKKYDFSYNIIRRHLNGERENAGGLHFIRIESEVKKDGTDE